MIRIFLALAAIGVAGHVSAADRSYTFAEFSYSHYENNEANRSASSSAKGLRGSFAVGDSGAYLLGAYRKFDYAGYNFDSQPFVSSRLIEVGAGYKYQLHSSADIFLEAARQRTTTTSGRWDYFSGRGEVIGSANFNSNRFSIGTRASFNEHVEVNVKLNHFEYSDYCGFIECSVNSYSAGLVAKVHRHAALTAEYEEHLDSKVPGAFGGPAKIMSAGLRISF